MTSNTFGIDKGYYEWYRSTASILNGLNKNIQLLCIAGTRREFFKWYGIPRHECHLSRLEKCLTSVWLVMQKRNPCASNNYSCIKSMVVHNYRTGAP